MRVLGYPWLEAEGTAAYPHRDGFEQGLTRNGLWANIRAGVPHQDRPVSGRYVLLEGRFDAASHRHLGLWSGTLDDIDRVATWALRAALQRTNRRIAPKPPPR